MQRLCGVQSAVLHVKAEHAAPAQVVKYYPREFSPEAPAPHKIYSVSDLPTTKPTETVGKTIASQPNAVACRKIEVPPSRTSAPVERPTSVGPSNELKVTMPVDYQDWLERQTFLLRNGWPNEVLPQQTAFSGKSLHGDATSRTPLTTFPKFAQMKHEIAVVQLENGKMNLFAEAKHPTLDRVDPEGDRVAHLLKTPAIQRFMRANQRFFFGSHEGAATHPAVIFKRPVHFANVKLADFRSGEILYDADFEVAGHQIAADQKPIAGKITEFPVLRHPFADERIFKLTVEADNPSSKFALEAFPVKKPDFQVDPSPKVKPPAAIGKSTSSEPPSLSTNRGPSGPLSERFLDHWRKMDFVFGVKHPVFEAEMPIAIRGAEFI